MNTSNVYDLESAGFLDSFIEVEDGVFKVTIENALYEEFNLEEYLDFILRIETFLPFPLNTEQKSLLTAANASNPLYAIYENESTNYA